MEGRQSPNPATKSFQRRYFDRSRHIDYLGLSQKDLKGMHYLCDSEAVELTVPLMTEASPLQLAPKT